MIELILSVCLVSDPARCEDVHLQFAEGAVTPQACLFNGQLEIAKWADTHPGWQIAKWQCARPRMAKA